MLYGSKCQKPDKGFLHRLREKAYDLKGLSFLRAVPHGRFGAVRFLQQTRPLPFEEFFGIICSCSGEKTQQYDTLSCPALYQTLAMEALLLLCDLDLVCLDELTDQSPLTDLA